MLHNFLLLLDLYCLSIAKFNSCIMHELVWIFPFQHSLHDPLDCHGRIFTLTPLSVITLCQHGQHALFGPVFGINIDTSGILW